MQVKELKIGQKARIIGLNAGDLFYRRQLLALGLIPGTPFTLLRQAPLGDPIQIEVRGFTLCLRKQEASMLQIEVA